MTNANLSTLSLSELKAVAAFHGTVPTGDKRSKQSWISAIESYRADAEVASAALVAELNADEDTLDDIRYCPHPEGLTDLCEEDDTFDLDGWDAPVTISDVEMEAIAHTADIAPVKADKSANSAVLIFGTLVCVLVLVFRVAFGMSAIAFKLGSYVVRLFGSYDPNLDLGWQFSEFRRQRSIPVVA